MMLYWNIAWRYLSGRRTRTFLTTLAIVFGVMVIFGLNGIIPPMLDAFRRSMMTAASAVDITVSQESSGMLPDSTLPTVQSQEGVAAAAGIFRRNIILPTDVKAAANLKSAPALTVTIQGVDPVSFQDVRNLQVGEGRFIEPGDQKAVVISSNLAKAKGLKLGDLLTMPSATGKTSYTVVGILADRPLPNEEAYMLLADAQAMFDRAGKITTVEARCAGGYDRKTVQDNLAARLESGVVLEEPEYGAEIFAAVSLGEVIMNAFGVIALIMGGFIIFNTFRTVVAERRRDIGMLRALGASRRDIINMVLVEGLIQGIIGTAVGMLMGYLMALLLVKSINPVLQSFVRFEIGNPTFSPATLALTIGLGLGVTLISGLAPAVAASRITPLEALRPVMTSIRRVTFSKGVLAGIILMGLAVLTFLGRDFKASLLGAFIFLVSLVLVSPALVAPLANVFGRLMSLAFAREGQIAEGNLSRQPHQAATTAATVMIGMSILLAMAGMSTSLTDGMATYISKSMGADFMALPQSLVLGGGNMGAGSELLQRIRGLDGIAAATSIRQVATQADGTAMQMIGIDPEMYPKLANLSFSEGDEKTAFAELAAGRNVMVTGLFATQNNIKRGDTLKVKTLHGEETYYVIGVATDYLNVKLATGFISQDNLKNDFDSEMDLMLMANMKPGADRAAVEAQIKALIDEYPAFTLFSSAEWRDSQLGMIQAAMGMLYVLMIGLAAPSLLALMNTLAINVIERTREIGMLRAVGALRNQISRMVLSESLLLAAIGTAFGILAGIWLGYALVQAMDVTGFKMTYFFPFAGILITMAVGLIFGAVAAFFPARRAARMEIVDALRYE